MWYGLLQETATQHQNIFMSCNIIGTVDYSLCGQLEAPVMKETVQCLDIDHYKLRVAKFYLHTQLGEIIFQMSELSVISSFVIMAKARQVGFIAGLVNCQAHLSELS